MENNQKKSAKQPNKISNLKELVADFNRKSEKLGLSPTTIKTVSRPTNEYTVEFRPFQKKEGYSVEDIGKLPKEVFDKISTESGWVTKNGKIVKVSEEEYKRIVEDYKKTHSDD